MSSWLHELLACHWLRHVRVPLLHVSVSSEHASCLLYTSDAADEDDGDDEEEDEKQNGKTTKIQKQNQSEKQGNNKIRMVAVLNGRTLRKLFLFLFLFLSFRSLSKGHF